MPGKLKVIVKLTWEDIWKYNVYGVYTKPIIIFITVIGFMMWGIVLSHSFGGRFMGETFPLQQLLFAIFFTVIIPLSIFWNARKSYRSNNRNNERIEYEFDNRWIALKGDSFESKLTWKKIHKVKETKLWFLIYASKVVAYIVPKRNMSEVEILELRKIIQSIPSLNFTLLKN